MAFSYARGGGWWLGSCACCLLACNLLLGNEDGKIAYAGASSGEPSASIDAATDAGSTTIDGSTTTDADAGRPRECRNRAAPTAPCFDDASCVATNVTVTWNASDGIPPAYPHGLALWDGYLYYSAQEDTTLGRNGKGQGQLSRVDTALSQVETVVSPRDGLSVSAPTIRDGFLFWRTWDAVDDQSAIHRLDLSGWTTGAPCADGACGSEQVASALPGRVEELWAASPTAVYARIGTGLRQFRKAAAWASTTLPPSISETKGRLGQAFWTGWRAGDSSSFGGQMTLYSLFEGGPQARIRWSTPGAGSSPIPHESSLVASSCDDTFLYESWAMPPLRRVDLDAGLDATAAQMFSPIDCSGCEAELTFAHVADARFSYLARPNAEGGLLAVEHQSGTARKLVAGDVWDVVVDDEAIYFTNVDDHSIGRIAKR